jgi:hypothetical protein
MTQPDHKQSDHERRRSKRRPILETFNLFISIPKKGFYKLSARDVSDTGILFDLDIEGEPPGIFPLNRGDTLDLRFYLNTTLFIPMTVKIARIELTSHGRQAGGEFQDVESPHYKAYLAFLHFLDAIQETAEIDMASG